jgi:hypothetical protein
LASDDVSHVDPGVGINEKGFEGVRAKVTQVEGGGGQRSRASQEGTAMASNGGVLTSPGGGGGGFRGVALSVDVVVAASCASANAIAAGWNGCGRVGGVGTSSVTGVRGADRLIRRHSDMNIGITFGSRV